MAVVSTSFLFSSVTERVLAAANYLHTIFDDSIAQYWAENGVDIGLERIIPAGTRIRIKEDIKEALEKKSSGIFVADSIVELAGKIGVNPTTLKATVDEYNEFCEKGHDDLFAKEPKYLRPLKGLKFYALKCGVSFIGSLGGIKVNRRMEVVDEKGNPIPGLYAGGMDAGGIYGDSYDVKTCGGTLSFGVNSGRIAGKNALKYLGK